MSALISPRASIHPYEGHTPHLGEGVLVLDNAVLVGQLTVGAHSSIWYNCVVRADINTITIGARSNIQDGSVLHVTTPLPLSVGDDVVAGHGVILHACTIGNGVMVGMGATVLDGAQVGDGCIVAAGALVAPGKVYDEPVLLVGNPAKPKRAITPEERQRTLDLAAKYQRTAATTAQALGLLPQEVLS